MDSFTVPAAKDLTKLYINGEYISSSSGETITVYNPNDGSLVTNNIPDAGDADVDLAVQCAERAFYGEWSQFTSSRRSQILNRLADMFETYLEPILRLDSISSGAPVSMIPTREKGFIVDSLRYYAGWCDKYSGEYFPEDDGFAKLVRHEPLGLASVCAAICPFNAPIGTLMFKLAPALATGNVVIVKPSEKTPLGSLALGPLFEYAGIPKGVVQILTGTGRTGALLASHMRVRKISFTGSVGTGKKIQIAAAQSNLKRVTLELGGKSPAIVFEDADLENATAWAVKSIMTRSGQTCVAASRIYVHVNVKEAFINRYVEQMSSAKGKMGDSQNPVYAFGPLVDRDAFERVTGFIRQGKAEAKLITGGGILSDNGCFVEPTVFLDPKPDARILREEIFGPVAVISTFSTEEEVIRMANNTEYGLTAGIFTRDITRAMRMSSRLESGVVGVNCISVLNLQVPFGGKKASGTGRELGNEVLRHYTEPKTVVINVGGR